MIDAVVLVKALPERLPTLGRELADLPGVYAAYSVAGDEDLVAVVRAADHEDLAEIVTARIARLAGITSLRTLIAFRSYSAADERHF